MRREIKKINKISAFFFITDLNIFNKSKLTQLEHDYSEITYQIVPSSVSLVQKVILF